MYIWNGVLINDNTENRNFNLINKDMKKIEEHIIEMLLENTGTHFLDSGGE